MESGPVIVVLVWCSSELLQRTSDLDCCEGYS